MSSGGFPPPFLNLNQIKHTNGYSEHQYQPRACRGCRISNTISIPLDLCETAFINRGWDWTSPWGLSSHGVSAQSIKRVLIWCLRSGLLFERAGNFSQAATGRLPSFHRSASEAFVTVVCLLKEHHYKREFHLLKKSVSLIEWSRAVVNEVRGHGHFTTKQYFWKFKNVSLGSKVPNFTIDIYCRCDRQQ